MEQRYRVYSYDKLGRIYAAIEIDCATDAEAVDAAQDADRDAWSEVWSGRRRVALIHVGEVTAD